MNDQTAKISTSGNSRRQHAAWLFQTTLYDRLIFINS